jgi:hypothetical protein
MTPISASDPQRFDAAYYERYYLDPRTRVVDASHLRRLADFVAAYLGYLGVPVRRVLDMGCGIGLWREHVARHFPAAHYHGVELSTWLCEHHGWEHGSVTDYRADEPYDLVICQGVLPYLDRAALRRAVDNLGTLCRGALYLEAATQEDYERDVIDQTRADPHLYRHRAGLYRRALTRHFREMGGGVWLSRALDVPLYALEHRDEP